MEEEEKKKKHPIRNFFIILFLLIIITLLWARFISTKGLIIKEYPVYSANLPQAYDGLKIVHFSDLHYDSTVNKKDLAHIVDKINELKPDIIVFTGDLFDDGIKLNETGLQDLKTELKRMEARLKKYAVSGNHDYEDHTFPTFMEDAGFTVLNNSYDYIFDNDASPILISGLPSSTKDTHHYEEAFAPLRKTETDEDYVGPISYKILLLHEPDNINTLGEYNIDLALAGHSHGGQVRFPFIGAVVKPLGAEIYYDAYYKVNNTDLFISSGLGTSNLKFRFFNKPSISFYRLYTKNTES